MKKSFLIAVTTTIICSFNPLFAQNDLVIFSEQGERFYVIINGVKQNATPETNVKITGMKQPQVSAKIIFDGGSRPDVDQKIYFMHEGSQVNNYEFVYAVSTNKKGEYKIRYKSSAPAVTQTTPPAGQTVIIYSTTPPAPVTVTETTTISTTTTTGGNTAPATGENINVNVNMGGAGVNMNVNVTETGTATSTSSSTTVTSTTTTSSATTNAPASSSNVYVLPGYSGPHNCNWPMSPADFEGAKASIKSKSFEDSKLTVAKQILGSNCMLSSQVKEVMLLFDFENTRLDFAKFAYGKTFDPGNYYKLNDAFDFESSIDELNKYINRK